MPLLSVTFAPARMNVFCRGSVPCARNCVWLPVFVPPTLMTVVVMPGAWLTIAHTSRALGMVFISSFV